MCTYSEALENIDLLGVGGDHNQHNQHRPSGHKFKLLSINIFSYA